MRLDEFQGVNAGYVLELYERYRQNPESIDPETRQAFASLTPPSHDAASTQPMSGNTSIQKIRRR
jgi:2-oxoglutarate dehydrogenase E1 component